MTSGEGVEIRLLGRFAVVRDGTEVPQVAFGGRKVRTLLKVLAARQGRFAGNDHLAEVLWPDGLPADPVANLQVLVNRARRALGGPGLVLTGQGGYSLADPPACTVDAERFLAAVEGEGRPLPALLEALSWWQGDPLPEEAYDEWASEPRARLFRARQLALEQAAAAALSGGDAVLAADLAAQAVEAEPLRESGVVLLVRALAAAGDGAGALTAYDQHRRALADELGVDPSQEAQSLHQKLLRELPVPSRPTVRRGASLFEGLRFVGRGDELARIHGALSTPGDRASVVLLAGPSGSGKTRLLDRLAVDLPAVRARAYLAERSTSWALLRSLLREVLARDIGHLAAVQGAAAEAIAWLLPELDGGGPLAADPESRRLLVQQGAVRLLAHAGVTVLVDDVQWGDPSSLGVLEATAEEGSGLSMVLAYRPEEVLGGSEVRGFLDRLRPVVQVDLGGLDATAIGELVEDQALLDALCRHTDRTPMAVTEVLRSLAADHLVAMGGSGRWSAAGAGALDRARVVGEEGQRRAIVLRAADQPEPDREALAVLALLARETAVSSLAQATGRSEASLLDSLSRLLRRGLVRLGEGGWAPAHDMVTEVVAASLDAADRVRLHAALASALQAQGETLLAAHHLRRAGDSRAAAQAYAAAAQSAYDACAHGEAAELAGTGLGLGDAGPARVRLLEVRGLARQRLGDFAGAREDLRAALAGQASGPARAAVLARLALLASGADDALRAAQLAELALVEAGPDPAARAAALEVASVLDMNLGQPERAAERAADALATYERLGDAGGMARILDARAMAQFLDGDVRGGGSALRRAADLFEDSGDLVRVVTPRLTAGHAAVFGGDPERGLREVGQALDLARTLGHPEGQAYSLWHRAEALAALGRAAEASAAAGESLEIATRLGHRGWTATAWRAVGLAAEVRGEPDEALAAYRRSLELADHLGLFACWAAARAALCLVALGSLTEASLLVERALWEGPPLGHYEARWAQVELAAARADPAATALAGKALRSLEAGGVVQGRDRLVEIARR